MYHKGQEIWLVEYPVMKGVIVSDPPEHIAGYGFVDVSVQYGEEIYIYIKSSVSTLDISDTLEGVIAICAAKATYYVNTMQRLATMEEQ